MSSAGSIQALASLGLMTNCQSPQLKASTGLGRYTLSPLVDFGWAAVVLGNIGIATGAGVAHYLLVKIVHWWRLRGDDIEGSAREMMRFPGASMSVVLLMMSGVMRGSALLLMNPDDRWTFIVIGVVGLIALTVGIILVFLALRHAVLHDHAAYVVYPFALEFTWPIHLLFPHGRWEPAGIRRSYGSVIGGSKGGGNTHHYPILALVNVAASLGSCLLSAVPAANPPACASLWVAIAVVHGACGVVYAVWTPLRFPIKNAVVTISNVSLVVLSVTSAAAMGSPTSSGATAVTTACAALISAASMVDVVYTVIMMAYEWWRSNRRISRRRSTPKLSFSPLDGAAPLPLSGILLLSPMPTPNLACCPLPSTLSIPLDVIWSSDTKETPAAADGPTRDKNAVEQHLYQNNLHRLIAVICSKGEQKGSR
jgi:hypothetical protein